MRESEQRIFGFLLINFNLSKLKLHFSLVKNSPMAFLASERLLLKLKGFNGELLVKIIFNCFEDELNPKIGITI